MIISNSRQELDVLLEAWKNNLRIEQTDNIEELRKSVNQSVAKNRSLFISVIQNQSTKDAKHFIASCGIHPRLPRHCALLSDPEVIATIEKISSCHSVLEFLQNQEPRTLESDELNDLLTQWKENCQKEPSELLLKNRALLVSIINTKPEKEVKDFITFSGLTILNNFELTRVALDEIAKKFGKKHKNISAFLRETHVKSNHQIINVQKNNQPTNGNKPFQKNPVSSNYSEKKSAKYLLNLWNHNVDVSSRENKNNATTKNFELLCCVIRDTEHYSDDEIKKFVDTLVKEQLISDAQLDRSADVVRYRLKGKPSLFSTLKIRDLVNEIQQEKAAKTASEPPFAQEAEKPKEKPSLEIRPSFPSHSKNTAHNMRRNPAANLRSPNSDVIINKKIEERVCIYVTTSFENWFNTRPPAEKNKIRKRLTRIQRYGDFERTKFIQNHPGQCTMFELKPNNIEGKDPTRIYYSHLSTENVDKMAIVILQGGDKNSQERDITSARQLCSDIIAKKIEPKTMNLSRR